MLEMTDKLYQDFFAQVLRLLPHLTVAEMENWMRNPDAMKEILAKFATERRVDAFPEWCTIKIGLWESIEDVRAELSAEGSLIQVHPWAAAMISKIEIQPHEDEVVVRLARVTPAQLGFNSEAELGDIYMAARRKGLAQLTGEMALALRIQYPRPADGGLEMGDVVRVAMKSIICKKPHGRGVFAISNGAGRAHLRGVEGTRATTCHPALPLAFVLL